MEITVIIPSIGRPTLQRTLVSLQNQNNPNWCAYVGFDGCNPTPPVSENRVTYVFLDKKVGGGRNYGGKVRNALIPLVVTDWMCFLDDDDTFRPDYVDTFSQELKQNPDADCIVFRMSYNPNDTSVLPPLGMTKPQPNQVGISFAVRKEFLDAHNIRFQNHPLEDFLVLQAIEAAGGKIIFSKEITYNIRF